MSLYRFSLIFVISNILSIDILCCDCCMSCRKQSNTMLENSGGGFRLSNTRLQSCIDNVVEVCCPGSSNYSLCGMTIFDECDKNMSDTHDEARKIIGALTGGVDKNVLNQLSDLEKRAVACMLGMAIGDAVGAPFEFINVNADLYDADNYSNIETRIVNPRSTGFAYGQWTDDCSMGLCLADSLIVNNGVLKPIDLMKRFLAWWYCGYNNASMHDENKRVSWGLGGTVNKALEGFIRNPTLEKAQFKDQFGSGNGSIMRNAAIPICYHNNLERALREAERQSYTTHPGVQAAECCRLLTYVICKIFNEGNSRSLREILNEISSFQTEIESIRGLVESRNNVESYESPGKYENWNWKDKVFCYNTERVKKTPGYIGGFSVDCMAMAFHILYYTNSFEQAIEVASKLCGDADTVAAVVGQMAGAYYSLEKIPEKWIKLISKWDNGDIIAKALLLVRINK